MRSETLVVKRNLEEQMQIHTDNIIQLYNYTLKVLNMDNSYQTDK